MLKSQLVNRVNVLDACSSSTSVSELATGIYTNCDFLLFKLLTNPLRYKQELRPDLSIYKLHNIGAFTTTADVIRYYTPLTTAQGEYFIGIEKYTPMSEGNSKLLCQAMISEIKYFDFAIGKSSDEISKSIDLLDSVLDNKPVYIAQVHQRL